jgi:hypothetical protein
MSNKKNEIIKKNYPLILVILMVIAFLIYYFNPSPKRITNYFNDKVTDVISGEYSVEKDVHTKYIYINAFVKGAVSDRVYYDSDSEKYHYSQKTLFSLDCNSSCDYKIRTKPYRASTLDCPHGLSFERDGKDLLFNLPRALRSYFDVDDVLKCVNEALPIINKKHTTSLKNLKEYNKQQGVLLIKRKNNKNSWDD